MNVCTLGQSSLRITTMVLPLAKVIIAFSVIILRSRFLRMYSCGVDVAISVVYLPQFPGGHDGKGVLDSSVH